MKKILLGVAFSLITTHSFAIDSAIKATEKQCKKLIRIHNMTDAEYKPGVDVRGNKVVGADLNGSNQIKLPKEITFDLGIDLAEKYNLGTGFSGKATLGQIKVKGRNIYWNGKKLDQGDNNAILEACLKQYAPKE